MIMWLAFFLQLNLGMCELRPEEVVRSSAENYPIIVDSLLNLDETKQINRSLEGEFDGKIRGGANARTEGYYSGDIYNLQVEKPFPFLNSKIYGGARQSYGDFPLYEGKSLTLGDGETFAGFSLSLLRNSLIDYNRYKLLIQKQEIAQAEAELEKVKIDVQTLTIQAYWNWVVAGYRLTFYEELLALAETRDSQIKKRIKLGDLSRIYEAENRQYITRRQAQVKKGELDFKVASFMLSLFYRTKSGETIPVTKNMLPPLNTEPLLKSEHPDEIYQKAVERNVELNILRSQEKQAQAEIRLGRNDMLPAVDMKMEWSRDRGVGPQNLAQNENRVMLQMEIPLEYRKGAGKRDAGLIKKSRVQTKMAFLKDKLRADVNGLSVKLNAMADIFATTLEQVTLAEKLRSAEMTKFQRGGSDLLTVNIREQNLAEAKISNLETLLNYHTYQAELLRIVLQKL